MKKSKKHSLTIFDYFDYFEFLHDTYELLKKTKHGFSLRQFAQKAGIPSHSYLLRVIQRKRKLSPKYVDNFCAALHLSGDECAYFRTLVAFNNGKANAQKETDLRRLLTLRRKSRKTYQIKDQKLKFFEHWYYPIVRELAVLIDFKDDFGALARRCIPRITSTQAAGAVKYLLENGFLKRSLNGRYSLADQFVSTGDEVNSTVLRKYHRTTIALAAEIFDSIDPKKRDISSLTLRVDAATFEKIKTEMQSFRKHLINMACQSKDPDMVCFVGMQLLPRSELATERKGERHDT